MNDTTWVEHPIEVDGGKGSRAGMPKYLAGPLIEPHDIVDDEGTVHVQPCIITGHCSRGKHEACWQASGGEPLDHDLDDCATAHRLRCRCGCHPDATTDTDRLF